VPNYCRCKVSLKLEKSIILENLNFLNKAKKILLKPKGMGKKGRR